MHLNRLYFYWDTFVCRQHNQHHCSQNSVVDTWWVDRVLLRHCRLLHLLQVLWDQWVVSHLGTAVVSWQQYEWVAVVSVEVTVWVSSLQQPTWVHALPCLCQYTQPCRSRINITATYCPAMNFGNREIHLSIRANIKVRVSQNLASVPDLLHFWLNPLPA
jgi:hypothetical protein